jgi:hypothetical protein
MLFNIEDWDRNRDEEEDRDEISNDYFIDDNI